MNEEVGVLEKRLSNANIRDKEAAVYVMEYLAVLTPEGELMPNFNAVSAMLNIPPGTLKTWWTQRGTIKKQSNDTLSPMIMESIKVKVDMLLHRIIEEIQDRGLGTFTNRDLLAFFDNMLKNSRLMENKSTSNVAIGIGYAHDHVRLPRKK